MLKIRKGGHRDLEKYYGLMEIDFDSAELIGKLSLHRAISKGEAELLIVFDEESSLEVAYALMLPRSLYGYALMKYMAVVPWLRGRGLGIETMRLINKRYADRQGIVAELTEFDDPEPDHLKKLMKFFSRFGYNEIDCDYRISGTTAHVFVKPIRGEWDILPVYHRILADFYSRVLTPAAMSRMLDISPAPRAAGEKHEG